MAILVFDNLSLHESGSTWASILKEDGEKLKDHHILAIKHDSKTTLLKDLKDVGKLNNVNHILIVNLNVTNEERTKAFIEQEKENIRDIYLHKTNEKYADYLEKYVNTLYDYEMVIKDYTTLIVQDRYASLNWKKLRSFFVTEKSNTPSIYEILHDLKRPIASMILIIQESSSPNELVETIDEIGKDKFKKEIDSLPLKLERHKSYFDNNIKDYESMLQTISSIKDKMTDLIDEKSTDMQEVEILLNTWLQLINRFKTS